MNYWAGVDWALEVLEQEGEEREEDFLTTKFTNGHEKDMG